MPAPRQDNLSKKWFFWSHPYKIEVMIISLIEMQELPNFGHMTTFTIELHLQFESLDKILLVTCCYHVIAFISKYHHFKKA